MAATVVPPVAPCAIATGRSRALSFSAPSLADEPLELVGLEADVRDSVEHRDRRGHRAAVGDGPLELERGLEVLGTRQPVRDDRRLERDDRSAVAERAARRSRTGPLLVSRRRRSARFCQRARAPSGRDHVGMQSPIAATGQGQTAVDLHDRRSDPRRDRPAERPARPRCRHAGNDPLRRRRSGRERRRVGKRAGRHQPSHLQAGHRRRRASWRPPSSRATASRSPDRWSRAAAESSSRSATPTASGRWPPIGASPRCSTAPRSTPRGCSRATCCMCPATACSASRWPKPRSKRRGWPAASPSISPPPTTSRSSAPSGSPSVCGPSNRTSSFATEAERAAVPDFDAAWVIKLGARGARFPEGLHPAPAGRRRRHDRRRRRAGGRLPRRRTRARDRGRRARRRHDRRDAARGGYPNVNEYASAPGSAKVISSVRSRTAARWRTSW